MEKHAFGRSDGTGEVSLGPVDARPAEVEGESARHDLEQQLLEDTFGKFLTKIEIAELCKGVYCVDLGESFQTHI